MQHTEAHNQHNRPFWLGGTRWLAALCIGIIAGIMTTYHLQTLERGAGDFTWPLVGARMLLDGANPYTDPNFATQLTYRLNDPLFYPLPAVLLVIPVSPLPSSIAAGVAIAICTVFLVMRIDYRWPVLLSASFLCCLLAAQIWPILALIAALTPGLLVLAIWKPNLGLIAAAYRGVTWGEVAGVAGLGIISLFILPTWPLDWFNNLRGEHLPPIAVLPFGPLLLLAVFWWRDYRARLLLLMALIPQFIEFYDQLPVFLIARTKREALIIAGATWLGYIGWGLNQGDNAWTSATYIAALLLIIVSNVLRNRAETADSLPVTGEDLSRDASQTVKRVQPGE